MFDEKTISESSTDTTDESVDENSYEAEDEDAGDEVKTESKETPADEAKSDDSEYYKTQADKYKKLYEDRTEALKRVSKAKKVEDDAGGSEEEIESPTVEIPDVVKKELDEFKKEQSLQLFDDVLETIAETQAEREALEYIYKSRIQPSGFTRKALLSDLADAKLILDKDKFAREVEAKTEAKVKKNIAEDKAMKNVGGGTSGRKPPELQESYNAEERTFMSEIADYKKRNNIK